jgi:hypothetical protein
MDQDNTHPNRLQNTLTRVMIALRMAHREVTSLRSVSRRLGGLLLYGRLPPGDEGLLIGGEVGDDAIRGALVSIILSKCGEN